MRRWLIAALVVLLAAPLWAQRSGAHAAGGHGGSGFGGHTGFSGSHPFGGVQSSGSAARGFTRGAVFSRRGSSNRGFSNHPFLHDEFRGPRIRGFRNGCFGYRCRGIYGYPWAYGGYFDPYWWWDSGSSYDEDYERDRAVASEMNDRNLEEQRMLRQEQANGDRDVYSAPTADSRSVPPPRAASGEQKGTAIMPATVLVFRDQHTKELQNYAIVGQTLWNFAPQHTEKIPLSALDLPATTKANDDRGVTFRVPSNNEAE